jgi:hypothetical protein
VMSLPVPNLIRAVTGGGKRSVVSEARG